MEKVGSDRGRLVLAALLGAVGGGLAVAIATRALPRLIGSIMSHMMQNRSSQMGEGGCSPADI